MDEEAKIKIMSAKCARVIACISKTYDVALSKATDVFYKSQTAGVIEKGFNDSQDSGSMISGDFNSASNDKALAEQIWKEFNANK